MARLPADHWPRGWSPTAWMAYRQTGAKLFVILSIALLPLALIGMGGTLQTVRLTDAEARARLRVASDESARSIAIELIGDMTALRVALNALGADPADAPSCARAQGIFAQQSTLGARFVIADRDGRLLCGQPLPGNAAPTDTPAPIAARIVGGEGLVLAISGPGRTTARAFFPTAFLARLGTPSTKATLFGTTLEHDGERLELIGVDGRPVLERTETMRENLGIADLMLRTSVRSAPISSSFLVALLLPLLMWGAAASIAWFVVDRLLIRPLRQLRASVAAFTPGTVVDLGPAQAAPAQEIRDLGDAFRAMSRTVALHEAGLAEGLVRQSKLTREVHHRVKNNLQVIASLINFHARGAPSADAAQAYGAIQRRVDALAVVHRNHFAGVEDNRGLNLRALVGELAAGIRASAPAGSQGLGITLDMDPFLVTQDVAVAVAFLVTEIVELAMSGEPAAQVRISLKPAAEDDGRARLRVVSRALIDSDAMNTLIETRYGRVMEGLSRQLRSKLHHDPLVGAYDITIAVIGHD